MTVVADCALDMRGISKTFPGVKALSNVNFAVKFGTVHAVVGENGAGKSTLMKVLNGSYAPTSGTIWPRRLLNRSFGMDSHRSAASTSDQRASDQSLLRCPVSNAIRARCPKG